MAIASQLFANASYTFAFQLQHPTTGQDSPNITISVQDAYYGEVITRAMTKGLGNRAPLLANDFRTLSIAQSDPSADANNVISVTLSTRAALEQSGEDFQIYICGLKGSTTATTSVLALSAQHSLFGSAAHWENGDWGPNNYVDVVGTHCLVLDTEEDSVAGREYAFSFTLRNQLTPQAAPTVSIFLYRSERNVNSWEEVLKAELPSDLSRNRGNHAAMLIAGFLRARAWQSSGISLLS